MRCSWHRNLPNGIEDSRIILKLVSELVDNFIAEPEPQSDRTNVVTLVQGDGRRA
jgi:hypothetical protein